MSMAIAPDSKFYFQRGEKEYANKNWSGAIREYSKAIKIDRNYLEAYFKRGLARSNADSLNQAIDDFNKTISLQTSPSGEPYLQRGNVRWKLKDSIGACSDWHDACEYNSNRGCEAFRKKCND